jgi:hypothetical protein
MASLQLILPADFDDYEWEVTAKGWYDQAHVIVAGQCSRLKFYDPVRLGQEIESEFELGRVFYEQNLVVIQSVTRAHMQRAVESLSEFGRLDCLAPS